MKISISIPVTALLRGGRIGGGYSVALYQNKEDLVNNHFTTRVMLLDPKTNITKSAKAKLSDVRKSEILNEAYPEEDGFIETGQFTIEVDIEAQTASLVSIPHFYFE